MKNAAGFTLIEVFIAMLVSLVIMGGAYSVFNAQQRQTTTQTHVSDAQQTVRAAMDFVSRDIRMAGYDPQEAIIFGIEDIQPKTIGGDSVDYIQFTWDKNGNMVLDNDETIEYSLVDSATITPGIRDLAIRLPNGTNTQDVLASNIIELGFAYGYDANDDGELDSDAGGNVIWGIDNAGNWDSLTIDQAAGTATTTATGTPVDTRTIRAVRIWMLAQSQAPDLEFTDTRQYAVGRHVVAPNNHFRHRILERTVLCRNMGLNL